MGPGLLSFSRVKGSVRISSSCAEKWLEPLKPDIWQVFAGDILFRCKSAAACDVRLAAWIDQRGTAAGYIRWVLAFISSRLSSLCSGSPAAGGFMPTFCWCLFLDQTPPPFSFLFICLLIYLSTAQSMSFCVITQIFYPFDWSVLLVPHNLPISTFSNLTSLTCFFPPALKASLPPSLLFLLMSLLFLLLHPSCLLLPPLQSFKGTLQVLDSSKISFLLPAEIYFHGKPVQH